MFIFNGPYELDIQVVNEVVKDIKCGVYKLGYSEKEVLSNPSYIGRSDTDLQRRLEDHVYADDECYTHFMYRRCTTVKEAYETECRMYHKYDDLENENHPDKPDGSNDSCPCCGK